MTHVSGDEASLPVVGSFGTLNPLFGRFKGVVIPGPLSSLFAGVDTEDPPDPSPGVVEEVEGDDVLDPFLGVVVEVVDDVEVVDVVDDVEVVGAVSLRGCDAALLGPSPTVFVATTVIV